MDHLRFSATVIPGRGRGKEMGTPTLNLDLQDIPAALMDGVYACWIHDEIQAASGKRQAAMHYGLRPTFGDTKTCEVHLLDGPIDDAPKKISVEVVARIRDVQRFDSPEALQAQIAKDIADVRRKTESKRRKTED